MKDLLRSIGYRIRDFFGVGHVIKANRGEIYHETSFWYSVKSVVRRLWFIWALLLLVGLILFIAPRIGNVDLGKISFPALFTKPAAELSSQVEIIDDCHVQYDGHRYVREDCLGTAGKSQVSAVNGPTLYCVPITDTQQTGGGK